MMWSILLCFAYKVYRVTRDSKNYIVALQNNSISFDVKTGKISYID